MAITNNAFFISIRYLILQYNGGTVISCSQNHPAASGPQISEGTYLSFYTNPGFARRQGCKITPSVSFEQDTITAVVNPGFGFRTIKISAHEDIGISVCLKGIY